MKKHLIEKKIGSMVEAVSFDQYYSELISMVRARLMAMLNGKVKLSNLNGWCGNEIDMENEFAA